MEAGYEDGKNSPIEPVGNPGDRGTGFGGGGIATATGEG
jgi:hypothetical protein